MRRNPVTLFPMMLLAILTLAAPAAALALAPQDPPALSPLARYQEAWYREVAESRYDEAFVIYEELYEQQDLDADLRARCLFRMGVCLGRLQRHDEARVIYTRVTEEFPGVEAVADDARRMVLGETEAEASFRRKVENLIQLLGDKVDSVRAGANVNLQDIGPRAAPMLLAVLGQGDFYTSREASDLLVRFSGARYAGRNEDIWPSIVTALRAGDEIVFENLSSAILKNRFLPIENRLAIRNDPKPEIRRIAMRHLGEHPRDDIRAFNAFLEGTRDGDPEVRRSAVQAIAFNDSAWQLDERTGFAALLGALDDEDELVCVAAAQAAADVLGRMTRTHTEDARAKILDQLKQRIGSSPPAVEERIVGVLGEHQSSFYESSTFSYTRALLGSEASDDVAFERILELCAVPGPARAAALRIAGASMRPEAFPALVVAIDASEVETARRAIFSLAVLGDPAAVSPLLSLLERTTISDIARSAAYVLVERFWSPETADAAVAQLETFPDSWVEKILDRTRYDEEFLSEAARRFRLLSTKARRKLLEVLMTTPIDNAMDVVLPSLEVRSLSHGAMDVAARRRDTAAVPVLLRLLADADAGVRKKALQTLSAIGDARMIPDVVDVLNDEDHSVRRTATQILQTLGRPEVLELVLRSLPDLDHGRGQEAWYVVSTYATRTNAREVIAALDSAYLDRNSSGLRRNVLQKLGELGDATAIPLVTAYLEAPDPGVRQRALAALGKLDATGSLPSVIAALEDPEVTVRAAAVDTLGSLNDPRILEPLISMLEGPQLRLDVVQALAKLGDPAAIPAIIGSLRTSNRASVMIREGREERKVLRHNELWSLRSYPPEPARLALRSVIDGDYAEIVRMDAIRVLARLDHELVREDVRELLGHPLANLRLEAAYAAGLSLDERMLPRLVELLRDPSTDVRRAARSAIGEIRFYTDQQRYAAEGSRGEGADGAAVEALLEMLSSEEAAVRLAAVNAIAKVESPRALTALVRARKDPDQGVRAAVEAALDRIAEREADDDDKR